VKLKDSSVMTRHLVYAPFDWMLPHQLGSRHVPQKPFELVRLDQVSSIRKCDFLRFRWAMQSKDRECAFICRRGTITLNDESFVMLRHYRGIDGLRHTLDAEGSCATVHLGECVSLVINGVQVLPLCGQCGLHDFTVQKVQDMWLVATKNIRERQQQALRRSLQATDATTRVVNGRVVVPDPHG
jgi:hypothetical protein